MLNLIDSGESVNYFRRRSLEESQRYDEALKAHRDFITVRLPTGARVTVPKVLLYLGVKVLDFDSIERCLVLDLESRSFSVWSGWNAMSHGLIGGPRP